VQGIRPGGAHLLEDALFVAVGVYTPKSKTLKLFFYAIGNDGDELPASCACGVVNLDHAGDTARVSDIIIRGI